MKRSPLFEDLNQDDSCTSSNLIMMSAFVTGFLSVVSGEGDEPEFHLGEFDRRLDAMSPELVDKLADVLPRVIYMYRFLLQRVGVFQHRRMEAGRPLDEGQAGTTGA